MKKMHKIRLLNLLSSEAHAKKEKALLSLNLYANNPVAVGEHTTDDLYEDIHASYRMYLDAIDEIESIEFLKKELEN